MVSPRIVPSILTEEPESFSRLLEQAETFRGRASGLSPLPALRDTKG